MAGFLSGLEAAGTGLGQFAQQYQQQQQQRQQQELLKLRIAEFLQNKQQEKDVGTLGMQLERSLGGGGAPAPISPLPSAPAMGAGMGGPQTLDMTRGADGAFSMPPSRPAPSFGPPVGGMARGGGADAWVNEHAPFPTLAHPEAPKISWRTEPPPPDATSAGPGAPSGLPAGAAPNQFPQQPGQPATPDPNVAQADPLATHVNQIGQAVDKSVAPYNVMGQMSRSALAAQIDKIAPPGTPDYVKLAVLDSRQKALAPSERQAWEMFKLEHDDKFKMLHLQIQQNTEALAERRADRMERTAGTRLLETSDGLAEWHPGQPIPQGASLPSASAANRASKNVEVTDAEGKVIFRGAAHQSGEGWVSDKDNQPVAIPPDGNINISSAASGQGRQAAMQLQRLTLAGNEIPAAMKNLVDLPIEATSGIFAGLQQEKPADLADALKRTLANKLTGEDAQSVQVSFQGVSRALAMLESAGAAQGLVGLTQRADVLMPREGDTSLTILRKYAEVRQLTERALETVMSSPDVRERQGALLKKMTDEIKEAVPWTVADVNRLQRSPNKATVSQFARSAGVSQSGGEQGGGPQEGQTATNPQTGAKVIYRGGQWVPQ
jgi:hypothetical protein